VEPALPASLRSGPARQVRGVSADGSVYKRTPAKAAQQTKTTLLTSSSENIDASLAKLNFAKNTFHATKYFVFLQITPPVKADAKLDFLTKSTANELVFNYLLLRI
jgi:hypothetical protein